MDADLQHPPEKVKEIIKKLEDYDVVVGTRKGIPKNWPFTRRLMSKTATLLARLRLMRSIKDPLSGFFGVRTDLFKEVISKKWNKFEGRGYKVLFDLLKYCPKNTSVGVVCYEFGLRRSGSSKIGSRQIRLFFKSLFK
jgi:dolichol-phosphate mannosyltransferase